MEGEASSFVKLYKYTESWSTTRRKTTFVITVIIVNTVITVAMSSTDVKYLLK